MVPRIEAEAMDPDRRRMLIELASVAGATVLVPWVAACAPEPPPRRPSGGGGAPAGGPRRPAASAGPAVPLRPPAGWDAMAFNLRRGEAGAIPAAYLAKIKAPGGDKKHLGKHLPYQPRMASGLVPAGYLAVMYGEAARGFARHPNSAPDPSRNEIGHWFNWIRVRKATSGSAEELENTYPTWPGTDLRPPRYAVFGGGDIRADGGRNTIHLVRLPADVRPGDRVRVWGHCLHHGEYADFLTL